MQPQWLAPVPWYQSVFIQVSAVPLSPRRRRPYCVGVATPETLTQSGTIVSLPLTNGTDLRRRELGSFLRSRRERVQPEQVGLRASRRRRTPGLRREEVAQLAGVGVTWYTWLEQAHLFTLAGIATTTIANQCLELCPNAQPLIDQLEPFPASVVNDRLDLLAFNRVYASFFDDLDTIPIEDRNLLWLAFTHPRWRKVMVDWDDAVGRMVAEYRASMAEHLDEPAWKTLVARLRSASREFATIWERHDVQQIEGRTKRAMHPIAGLLSFDYTNLWLGQRLGTRIVAFTPADERTRRRLDELYESLV
jgi:MmyB-like transcription regulator ligand binding domain